MKSLGEDTADAAMLDVEMMEGSRQKPRGARWIAEEVRIIRHERCLPSSQFSGCHGLFLRLAVLCTKA